MEQEAEFQPINLPMKRFPDGTAVQYRVFRSRDDVEVVDASTVSEAMEKSGIERPWKVERVILGNKVLYKEEELEVVSAGETEESPSEAVEATAVDEATVGGAAEESAAEANGNEDSEAGAEEAAEAVSEKTPKENINPEEPLSEDAVNQLLSEES